MERQKQRGAGDCEPDDQWGACRADRRAGIDVAIRLERSSVPIMTKYSSRCPPVITMSDRGIKPDIGPLGNLADLGPVVALPADGSFC